MSDNPKAIYLKDYQPPQFFIDKIELVFEIISNSKVLVESRCQVRRNGKHQAPLVLDGEELTLKSVILANELLDTNEYELTATSLTIPTDRDNFELLIKTEINPEANKALSGLYVSNDIFCTQCEAEGFRRITYFIDRPDNMALFQCTIIADEKKYPVILSNGNMIEHEKLDDGRHAATWNDPFKKPSYLFALVAGDLVFYQDEFTTKSGESVILAIYTEHGNKSRCKYAMESLKKAMRWDEEHYGREYDLNIFNIVAVSDFNMGAMENKSLNIFNAKYILADKASATDDDYKGIEMVVAHEYFHNWTGNRITCRDWFQLSLKEGLTVFREQQFTQTMNDPAEARIKDVRLMRAHQFPEDSGPMAHPVQPDSYIEINNFYTMTIYHKGAEINHMLYTLLGPERFRKGCDLYFERHDGQAVTIHEWVGALADANNIDLSQFMLWYQQAGTPELTITDSYDSSSKKYQLTVKQSCKDTPGQKNKKPFHIPLKIGLISQSGEEFGQHMLELKSEIETFEFETNEKPLLSLLRGFSAPVKVTYDYANEDLLKLLTFDSDGVAQWEAGQELYNRELLPAINKYNGDIQFSNPEGLIEALIAILNKPEIDNALKAQLLTLPTYNEIAERLEVINASAIVDVKQALVNNITTTCQDRYLQLLDELKQEKYQLNHTARAERTLRNLLMAYLVRIHNQAAVEYCLKQYDTATNMTDKFAALHAICQTELSQRDEMLDDFYRLYAHDPLIIDKWLSVQATSSVDSVFNHVKALSEHHAFNIKNPNKVRALLGAFAQANPKYFHSENGEAYNFYTDKIIEIDRFNPQVAARLLSPYTQWKKYQTPNRDQLQLQLTKISDLSDISRDVYEIVNKSLDSDSQS